MLLSRTLLTTLIPDLATYSSDLTAPISECIAEVEHVTTTGCTIPGIVVGVIRDIQPVPGADKIRLTTTEVGDGQLLSIICGAPNIAVGMHVPVATIGAVLPGDFRIEKRKMKGIESHGMLCSARELGIGTDAAGILPLPADTIPGTPLSDVLPSDTIYEIDNHAITHRPDLFSHVGFAREIATLTQLPLVLPALPSIPADLPPLPALNAAPAGCLRYTAYRIEGITVADSPQSWKDLLSALGQRSINTLVDATNLAMLLSGQPLHAFDARDIEGTLGARYATPGETITLLGGEEKTLTPTDVVIADSKKALALAGIKGGFGSSVRDDTTTIILESATFDAVTIRHASKAHALRTESSLRYEKRLPPELTQEGVKTFLFLLAQVAPNYRITAAGDTGHVPAAPRTVSVTTSFISQKLGTEVSPADAERILTSLGFTVAKDANTLTVTVPYFRAGRDIAIPEDLVEEVGRHLRYTTLPTYLPKVALTRVTRTPLRTLIHRTSDLAVSFGFSETITLALVPSQLLVDPAHAVTLVNPPSAEFAHLRDGLASSLLKVVTSTDAPRRLFEVSSVFTLVDAVPTEEKRIAFALSGEKDPYRTLRGALTALLAVLRIPAHTDSIDAIPALAHPGRAAGIYASDGSLLGTVYESHPDTGTTTAFAELTLPTLLAAPKKDSTFTALPQYPAITRDISCVVAAPTKARDHLLALSALSPLVADVTLIDDFTGAPLPENARSLTFSLTLRAPDRTLQGEEADTLLSAAADLLTQRGAQVR